MKMTDLTLAVALAVLGTARVHADHKPARDRVVGGVYTMDNAAAGNNVWAFGRKPDGSLTDPTAYPTGGTGTGAGLGNQGAVLLSPDGHWLFTCNAGSDDISVFGVTKDGLILSDKVASQGQRPVSLTLHRNLLYVLNAGGAVPGGADNVAGFLFVCGRLIPLPGSAQNLSAADTAPAQLAFTRDGDFLVVTEKGTGLIDVFTLGDCGFVDSQQRFASPYPPPFGFGVGRHDRIFVTQANGANAEPVGGSVSSYEVTEEGGLNTISDSVPTGQMAACWLVLTRNERFAYTANTPSDSVSSFVVRPDGSLELLESQAGSSGPGSLPLDMALSRDNRFLYTLNSGNGTIGAFGLNAHTGALRALPTGGSVPATANGLAAQ